MPSHTSESFVGVSALGRGVCGGASPSQYWMCVLAGLHSRVHAAGGSLPTCGTVPSVPGVLAGGTSELL